MTDDLYQRWEEAKQNHSHIPRDIDTVINEVRGNPNKIPFTNPKTTREMSRLMLINTGEQGIWPWQPLKLKKAYELQDTSRLTDDMKAEE